MSVGSDMRCKKCNQYLPDRCRCHLVKPVEPFYFHRCSSSFRWSFGVNRFDHMIKGHRVDYTCFPQSSEEYQQIYDIFWRFIGAK